MCNIDWDIDIEEAIDYVQNMPCNQAASSLNLAPEKYKEKSDTEKRVYAFDFFHHCPGAMDDLFGLPSEAEVPAGIEEDEIADWLSDKYGFCVNGFVLESELKK